MRFAPRQPLRLDVDAVHEIFDEAGLSDNEQETMRPAAGRTRRAG